jgi:hypothetical protein
MAFSCPMSRNAHLCGMLCGTPSQCKRTPEGREREWQRQELINCREAYADKMREWIKEGPFHTGCPECGCIIENSQVARRRHAESHKP